MGGAFGGSGYCADRWCFGCDYELLMREVKSRWRKALRGSLLVALAAIVFFKTTTLLWAPLLLLALFFYAVDIFSIDKRKSAPGAQVFEKPIAYGRVGEYVVDSTPSFGLFIELQKEPVFIAIKRDRFVEERKARAEYLFQHQSELNDNLSGFLNENPSYRSKRLTYIGLHSNSLEQGELFWSPDGYTILRGLNFLTPG
jgi:hypothetical protein